MVPRTRSKLPSLTYKWSAYLAIALGIFTSVADNGSVVVALPTISEHFGTDLPITQWVVMAYALTVSVLLLPMGRLSDIVGRKQVYVTGFGLFVPGALLAASANDMLPLLAARVLMGVGAAMIQGTSMAIVISSFPESERGKALGLQMSAVGAGGVAGPVIGGLIVSAFGWRGVFLATAVLGVLAAIVAQLVLTGHGRAKDTERPRFDWLGAALSSLVLATFLLVAGNGAAIGWTSLPILAASLSLLGFLGAFVWWELGITNPMLDVRLFKSKLFSLGALARFISFLGISSIRFLMPFFLQTVQGYTPRQIGLIVVPSAISLILTGPIGGRISDRWSWRVPVVAGLVLSALGLFVLARLTESMSLVWVVAAMVTQSVGSGIFGAPNSSAMLSIVEPEKYGVVSGFLNLVRNAGNVAGIAVATAIVTAVMVSRGAAPTLTSAMEAGDTTAVTAFVAGLRVTYTAAALLVLLGAAVSVWGLQRRGVAPSPQTNRPDSSQSPR